jgi:hypothetical protein
MGRYMSNFSNHQRETGENIVKAQLGFNLFKFMIVNKIVYDPTNYMTSNPNMGLKKQPTLRTKMFPLNYISTGNTNTNIRTLVNECLDIMKCVAPGKGHHIFMQKEGFLKWHECNLFICKTCTLINDEDQFFCVNCSASTQFANIELIKHKQSS